MVDIYFRKYSVYSYSLSPSIYQNLNCFSASGVLPEIISQPTFFKNKFKNIAQGYNCLYVFCCCFMRCAGYCYGQQLNSIPNTFDKIVVTHQLWWLHSVSLRKSCRYFVKCSGILIHELYSSMLVWYVLSEGACTECFLSKSGAECKIQSRKCVSGRAEGVNA